MTRAHIHAMLNKPFGKSELADYDSKPDLAAELLQSAREMKDGQVQVVTSPIIEAGKKHHGPDLNLP